MKGEYITQKENLIWEEVQIFFFRKEIFFPKRGYWNFWYWKQYKLGKLRFQRWRNIE